MNYGNVVVKKMNFNGQKVKKWYHNGVKVFSSGNIVTYNVDTENFYQEEVDSETTVLSPKTFTPTKSGWTFAGWREDTTASSSVLSSKVMGDEPITLYAVFKRTLTATFSGNGANSGSVASISGTQYFNNGNYNNPDITLPSNGYSRTNYIFSKWDKGTPGTKITLTESVTITAQWSEKPWTEFTIGQLGSGWGDSTHVNNYFKPCKICYNAINFDNVNQIRIVGAGYGWVSPELDIYYSNTIGNWDSSGRWPIWKGRFPSYGSSKPNFTTKIFDVSAIKGVRYVTINIPDEDANKDAITKYAIELRSFAYR